jgi:Helix-turn-helix domain
MMNAAHVLPAGPGERDDDAFPIRERLRFRDNLGLGLRDVRVRPAFAALAKGPWALFIAIAVHWQGNAEAWPSQETLARFSGWSSRAVRDQADTLERGGFIRLRRERRGDGSERIFYAPGLVTLLELAAFVERFPRERAKPLPREPIHAAPEMPPPAPTPPEGPSGSPPEGPSMELRDQDQIKPSSCEARQASALTGAEEQQRIEVGAEDREVARRALEERMQRKHPTRPAPRWFDAGELALVVACSSAIEGNDETKVQAHREAIVGAFLVSKDGPPTVRFIWGKLDHFLDHVERGRRKLRAERASKLRSDREVIAATRVIGTSAPAISHEQMTADIERLFGPGWRTPHVPR